MLAAGAGTRLRPLTDRLPKALIEVAGRPLLAHVLDRLVEAGATRIIVNCHYHEHQIRSFLGSYAPGGVDIVVSPEPDGPYDTGGGLFRAARLFQEKAPFLLHNVDVLSKIPLDGLLAAHRAERNSAGDRFIASLAVQARDANRQLLFDAEGLLGWENRGNDGAVLETRRVREPIGELTRWSFTGIHALEPDVFHLHDRSGSFSIITLYLELAAQGSVIRPIDMSGFPWIDVGTHERLVQARETW